MKSRWAFHLSYLRMYLFHRFQLHWGWLFETLGTVSALLVFYVISQYQDALFGSRLGSDVSALSNRPGGYFGYVALGLCAAELAQANFGGGLALMGRDRSLGVFEPMMSGPRGLTDWAIASGLSNVLNSVIRFLMIACVAVSVFGLPLPAFSLGVAILFSLLAVIPLWSLGVVSMSTVLITRRSDVFGFILGLIFEVVSGVYVPVEVLPDWVKTLSMGIPLTPVIVGIQKIVFENAGILDVASEVKHLLILGVLYLPISFLLLRFTDSFCRKQGRYMQHT